MIAYSLIVTLATIYHNLKFPYKTTFLVDYACESRILSKSILIRQ